MLDPSGCFLFGPEGMIIVIGQDGRVANVAKYLTGQPILRVNPAPDIHEGVLVPLRRGEIARLAPAAAAASAASRTRP